jgi:hypothetical protein
VSRSVYLGQFTDDNAERLVEALEDADIRVWVKSTGRLVRAISAQDWGVRVFVDDADLERARAIARDVAPGGLA